MVPFAYFGIDSGGLNLAIDLVILFIAVLYISLIYWTYADARRRVLDPLMVGFATAVSLFPFVGTIIYLILRPPEYLEDVRERELEMQAAEARLQQLDYGLCPHCDYQIERDFIRCPSCLRKLKDRCVSCSRPLDRTWTICPYCETEVPGSVSSRRGRRRDSAASDEELSKTTGALGSRAGGAESARGEGSRGTSGSSGSEGSRAGAADSTLSSELGSRPRGTSRPRPTP